MQYTIHETYEYVVNADSEEAALDAYHAYMEDGDNIHGVVFTQNYVTTNNDGGE